MFTPSKAFGDREPRTSPSVRYSPMASRGTRDGGGGGAQYNRNPVGGAFSHDFTVVSGAVESSGCPVMNEYTEKFAWKRWPQTCLGGLRLRLGEGNHPHWIYTSQLALLLFPAVFGIPLTMVAPRVIAAAVAGGASVLYTLCLWAIARRIRAATAVGVTKTVEIFQDEDTLDFDDGFLSASTWDFLVPAKDGRVALLHAVVGGLLCAGAAWFFSLPLLGAGDAVFAVLGWLVVCVAHNGLTTAPVPDGAQHHLHDTFGLAEISRALYLILVFAVDFAVVLPRWCVLLLPLGWMFALLPQWDALLLWAFEQLLVFVHGGTAAATAVRLVCMLVSAWAVVAGTVVLFPTLGPAAAVGFASGFSAFFSLDLWPSSSSAVHVRNRRHRRISTCLWAVLALALTTVGIALDTAMGHALVVRVRDVHTAVAAVLSAVWLLAVVSSQLQRPWILRYFRNPLYSVPQVTPAAVTSSAGSRRLAAVHRVSVLLLQVAMLLISVMWMHAALQEVALTPQQFRTTEAVVVVVALGCRMVRVFWHWPMHTVVEMAAAAWLLSAHVIFVAQLPMVLFLISIAHHRFRELCSKLFYVYIALHSFHTVKKQRTERHHLVLVAAAITLLPSLILSTLLSSPLLPLLGLPVFLPAFPRPWRHWSTGGTGHSKTKDTVFYAQMVPSLMKSFQATHLRGLLDNACPNTFYLLRREGFVLVVQVLERGPDYLCVLARGLELQETSCHTVEAQFVDEIFDTALMPASSSTGRRRSCDTNTVQSFDSDEEDGAARRQRRSDLRLRTSRNQHFGYSLSALGTLDVVSYSMSSIQLTGVIDSPTTLQSLRQCLLYTLVWQFHRRCVDLGKPVPDQWLSFPSYLPDVSLLSVSFPSDFHKRVRSALKKAKTPTTTMLGDTALFERLVLVCWALVEEWGASDNTPSALHIYRVFTSQLPSSFEAEWLEDKPELAALIVCAYRKAFKLAFDMVALGLEEDTSSIYDALCEYERDYYMGVEEEPEWGVAVTAGTANLMSLSREDGVFRARVLTTCPQLFWVGKLNAETSQGIWASLALELLYFTNDDDERYSIQAHPNLLRNLNIQAAEPPFGYPVFAAHCHLH